MPVVRQMLSLCSKDLKPSWKSIRDNWCVQLWSWRKSGVQTRTLQRLEAMLIVADKKASLIITGNGDVMEPVDGILAIGSGSNFARSAAIALTQNTDMPALEVVEKSLNIAGDICVYTNHSRTIEELDSE